MLAPPKVEISIRSRLHLAAPLEYPVSIDIGSTEHVGQQKEQVRLRQPPLDPARTLGTQLGRLHNRAAINRDSLLSRTQLSLHRAHAPKLNADRRPTPLDHRRSPVALLPPHR